MAHVEVRPSGVELAQFDLRSYPEWRGEVSGIEHTKHYINSCGQTVTVVLPSNIKFEVKPIIHHRSSTVPWGRFVIREHYCIDGTCTEGVHAYLSSLPPDKILTRDLRAFRDGFMTRYRPHTTEPVQFYVDTIILGSEINSGDELYVISQDICLSIKPIAMVSDHPFSTPELVREKYEAIIDQNNCTALIFDLVDNKNEVGDRYFYSAKRCHLVKPHKDLYRASGLYVTIVETRGGVKLPLQELFCKLEQMESEFGLYKTKEEAETGGNPKMVKEAELTELRRKNLEAEQELETLKREQVVLKAKLEEKKAHREDFYHDREHQRKDLSEVFKVAGAVVAGVCGIFIAMFKLLEFSKKAEG